jgi:phospholipid transport system substrate-binding protein
MSIMPRRRFFLMTTAVAALTLFAASGARAQGADAAGGFVKATGDRLAAAVNAGSSAAEKRKALTQIIDGTIDVDGVARFCLGRFWRQATPDQQKRYTEMFHQVLVSNITTRMGEYQGVKVTIGRTRQQDDDSVVTSTVDRPNNPPTTVDWLVSKATGQLKITDVIAEGTSLRLTQRSDYAAYLTRNNNNIDALIEAMKQQIVQGN